MSEYKQRCPGCYAGPYRGRNEGCKLCVGGYLCGNGSAQTNNTNRRSAMAYESVGRNWDNIVRASEEVA